MSEENYSIGKRREGGPGRRFDKVDMPKSCEKNV